MWSIMIIKRDCTAQGYQAAKPQSVRIVQSKDQNRLPGEVIRISSGITGKNGKAASPAVARSLSEKLTRSLPVSTESGPDEQLSDHVCSLAYKLDA